MANTAKNKSILPLQFAACGLLLVLLVAMLFLFFTEGKEKQAPAAQTALGNAGGNLSGGGMALAGSKGVYLTDPASGQLLLVTAGEVTGEPVAGVCGSYLNTDGTTLWYIDGNTGALMSSKLDGADPVEVVPGRVDRLTLAGDYLYFVDTASNYTLCRVSTAGGSAVEPLSAARVMQYAVLGERIFYRDLNATDALCYMGLDGSNPVTLGIRLGQVLFSADRRVYFSDADRDGALDYCEYADDGKYYGPTPLETGTVTAALADDLALYCVRAEDGRLCRLDLAQAADGTATAELLVDAPVYGIQDAGGYIYYRSVADGGVWGAVAKN